MRALLRHPIVPFAGAVTGAGALAVAVHAAATAPRLGHLPWEFWLFAAFVVAGELLPIRVPRRSQFDKVTTSDTFAFAILLGWGVGPAVLALAVASAVDDAVARTPPRRAAFNLAQYALSAVAAGAVLDLLDVARLGTDARFSELEIPAIALAAAIFFLMSYTLAGVAQALSEGMRPLPYLREDVLFQAGTARCCSACRRSWSSRRRSTPTSSPSSSCRCSRCGCGAGRPPSTSTRRCTTPSPACRTDPSSATA